MKEENVHHLKIRLSCLQFQNVQAEDKLEEEFGYGWRDENWFS